MEPRQRCGDFVHHAISEVFLIGITAHILERQHRDGRLIRKGKRFSVVKERKGRHPWSGEIVYLDTPDAHGFGDILQRLRTRVLKGDVYLATNLPVSIVGNTDAARFCDPFETHCNIDPITKDIIVCDDNITDVNADAKFDPFVLRHIGILFGHAALDFVGTSHGIDHAGELNESAVSGILDDASTMISDFGIKKRLSKSFQLDQRAFFVDPYQAARARDICRQNSCQSPLYVLDAQDGPPGQGEIECSYSTIVGRCPAMLKFTGQMRNTPCEQMFSASPPHSDIARYDRHFAFVPQAEVVVFAKRPIRLYGHPRIGYLWCNFWILQLPNRRSGHKWRKRGKTVRKPLLRKGARCAQTDAYGC